MRICFCQWTKVNFISHLNNMNMESSILITYGYVFLMMIVAYLLGSIPSAVWIGKRFYGVDIREHGSKNAGATNMLRVLGKRAAMPVFALDYFKGFLAVTLIGLLSRVGITEVWVTNLQILGVFTSILGHIFPIFANFRGGKGVATLVGAVTAIDPVIVLSCLGVWFIIFLLTHYVSLASMIAGCCFPILVGAVSVVAWSKNEDVSITLIVFSVVIAGLLIWSHRSNIERLKSGTESKIYLFGKQAENNNKQEKKE